MMRGERELPPRLLSQLEAIARLEHETQHVLHLTPNEIPLSPVVARLVASSMMERYYMGAEPGSVSVKKGPVIKRGNQEILDLVETAKDSVRRLLGADEVSFDCLSGMHAMSSVLLAVTEPGDSVMHLAFEDGGHAATAGLLRRIGRCSVHVPWDGKRAQLDLEELGRSVRENNVRAVYFDVACHLDVYHLDGIRETIGPDVFVVYDASHTLGLIMGGVYPNPLTAGADMLIGNTHKTFPGPQKALVSWRRENLSSIDVGHTLGSLLVSSTHTHHVIALAFAILEFEQFGAEYARAVVDNANELARRLVEHGYRVNASKQGDRITHVHQVHFYADEISDCRLLYERLDRNRISTTLIVDENTPLYIRLGTQDVTRRGMGPAEMNEIGDHLDAAIRGRDVSEEVVKLVTRFVTSPYVFSDVNSPLT